MELSSPTRPLKECFVSVNKSLIDTSPKSRKPDPQATCLKKCVVFLDRDSIINAETIHKNVRAKSIPITRPASITHKRKSLPRAFVGTPIRKSPSRSTPNKVLPEMATPKVEPALASELKRAIDEKNLLTTKTKAKFFSALNELEKATEEENRKRYKERALEEVVSSEKAYIKQLETIINYFYKPLQEKALILTQDLETIFGSFTGIYNLNKELLGMLQGSPNNVGAAFVKVAPFLKLYSSYAYDFKNILDILEKNEDINPEFHKFVRNQESRPEVQAKLSALLITPIQRVPRYCLLLKQILQHTLPTERGYDKIKESLEEVEKSAKHIDTIVEQKENSNRLLEIQNALVDNYPTIIRPGRTLIHEGKILKILPNSVSVLYLILLNDILLFCKIKKYGLRSKNSLKCDTIYPLSNCTIVEKNVTRNMTIGCGGDSMQIYIEKERDFKKWCHLLKSARNDAVDNRRTLQKESSLRKPAFRNDLSMYNEDNVSPVKMQRKRRLHEHEDSNATRSGLFLDKIESENVVSPSKKIKSYSEKKDSLFPLRNHFISREKRQKSTTPLQQSVELQVAAPSDVFVFGRQTNVDRGFNFRVSNFFSSIGSSLKRLFRYNK